MQVIYSWGSVHLAVRKHWRCKTAPFRADFAQVSKLRRGCVAKCCSWKASDFNTFMRYEDMKAFCKFRRMKAFVGQGQMPHFSSVKLNDTLGSANERFFV